MVKKSTSIDTVELCKIAVKIQAVIDGWILPPGAIAELEDIMKYLDRSIDSYRVKKKKINKIKKQ